MTLPIWVCGVVACAAFVAGCGSATMVIAWLWWRKQSTGSASPFQRGGRVLPPLPSDEERAAKLDYPAALEYGTREILEEAKARGRPITWDDAQEAARHSLLDVFPDAILPD